MFRRRALTVSSASLVCLLLAGVGCGDGCGSGDTPYAYPRNDPAKPEAVIQDKVARARITQGFLDFIQPQLPTLLRSALGNSGSARVDANGVLHVRIPNADLFDIGVAEAKLRDGEAYIWLDDLDQKLSLEFKPPSHVALKITDLRLGVSLKLKEDALGTDSSCPVVSDLGPDGPGPLKHAAVVDLESTIDLGIGPDPERRLDVNAEVGEVQIDDIDVSVVDRNVYCNERECQDCVVDVFGGCRDPGGECGECRIFCGAITSAAVSLATALSDVIKPLIGDLVTGAVSDALDGALGDLNDQPAVIEQQFALQDLLPIPLKRVRPVGVFLGAQPGRFPVEDRGFGLGLEITADGGAESEASPCVPMAAPFVPSKGPIPNLSGVDRSGEAYHVGMTLAADYLNHALWAAHRAGALCLELSSADIRDLAGGTFTLDASVLSLLAPEVGVLATGKAPVIIELKPRNPPKVALGTGEITGQDADGNDLYDWLIHLSLEDLGVAFHVFAHDRYVRVFEVGTNVRVGMNLNLLPDNEIEIAIGDIKTEDFEERFNELVPSADFGQILPSLIDVALGSVLQNDITFDFDLSEQLSDALGGAPIAMRVNEVFRDGVLRDYLTLSLTFTSSPTANLRRYVAETRSRIHDAGPGLVEPNKELKTRFARPTGRLYLQAEPYDATSTPLLYQARIDRGVWRVARAPAPDGTLVIEAPVLKIPGKHLVEVRARRANDPESQDRSPERYEVLVDLAPPKLVPRWDERGLIVAVEDEETDERRLRLEARTHGGAWLEVPLSTHESQLPSAIVSKGGLAQTDDIELRAEDASGNRTGVLKLSMTANQEAQAEAATFDGMMDSGCGCTSAHPKSSGLAVPLVILLSGVVFLIVRRSAR